MKNHKNTILILISIVLFVYAGFISIYPAFLTKTFNVNAFEDKVFKATDLITTIDSVRFEVKPNFDMIISIGNWNSKYIDYQDCFEAGRIEITTGPFSTFTKNFKIKEMIVKNAKYSDQILKNGENKLAHLPAALNTEPFGAKKVTVTPGPVKVKNFHIIYITPNNHKERKDSAIAYSKEQVRYFLQSQNFSHVVVK